ncbi:MAG: hypothetical protein KDE27_26965 [Planctomycetes bacterium]|nr:hypothetical protein [Planctomycetota bacterium]
MPVSQQGRQAFESTIQTLKGEIANVGAHLAIDAGARQAYALRIEEMANELRTQATSGRITWSQAAEQAQQTRNTIMEVIRGRSTPVGRALAESLKREGKTLNELVARKAMELFGAGVDFNKLNPVQKNQVYAAIVKSAGKSNPKITAAMRTASRAGRALLFLSIAVSVYTVATADDPAAAAKREIAVTGAGIGGGILGGAAAGLACGPGAPVCVGIGAFVGGALAAFGVDALW